MCAVKYLAAIGVSGRLFLCRAALGTLCWPKQCSSYGRAAIAVVAAWFDILHGFWTSSRARYHHLPLNSPVRFILGFWYILRVTTHVLAYRALPPHDIPVPTTNIIPPTTHPANHQLHINPDVSLSTPVGPQQRSSRRLSLSIFSPTVCPGLSLPHFPLRIHVRVSLNGWPPVGVVGTTTAVTHSHPEQDTSSPVARISSLPLSPGPPINTPTTSSLLVLSACINIFIPVTWVRGAVLSCVEPLNRQLSTLSVPIPPSRKPRIFHLIFFDNHPQHTPNQHHEPPKHRSSPVDCRSDTWPLWRRRTSGAPPVLDTAALLCVTTACAAAFTAS
jgi:hypothetical protein